MEENNSANNSVNYQDLRGSYRCPAQPKRPFKQNNYGKNFTILTSDLLIEDCIIDYANLSEEQKTVVDELMSKEAMKLEKKHVFKSEKDFDDFAVELKNAGITTQNTPGGSSANTITTWKRMLGGGAKADFIGVAGNSEMIRKSLHEAGVNLFEPSGDNHQAATSFVVVKDGKRSIITWSGDARHVFTDKTMRNELLTDDKVKNADAILLQGSLPYKFGETIPAFNGYAADGELAVNDWLLKKRWEHGKELYLTMPTQADFSVKYDENGQEIKQSEEERKERREKKAAYYRWVVKSANLVMSNGEEISRVYTTEEEREEILSILETAGERQKTESEEEYLNRIKKIAGEEKFAKYDFINKSVKEETALERLREIIQENPLVEIAKEKNFTGKTSQIAFVTLGEKGSVVITKDKVTKLPAIPIDEKEIVSTLGAGDTAYAGFLAGYALKAQGNNDLQYEDCANLGMLLAREKMKIKEPRLPYHLSSLCDAVKKIDDSLQDCIKNIKAVALRIQGEISNNFCHSF